MDIQLPIKRKKGAQRKGAKEEYIDSLRVFAEAMKKIQGRLDFHMGSRGWCYAMEPFGLKKSDFDFGQACINDCRRRGFLKPCFILDDESHIVEQQPDESELLEDYINMQYEIWQDAEADFRKSWQRYDGVSFWEGQDYYIQLLVEKVDLKSLFKKICNKHRIPIANLHGSGSIEQKAAMAHNFQYHENEGRQPILFACGDFDPPGQEIREVLKDWFVKYIGFTGWNPKNLIVDPIGLTYSFIQENKLTWIDNLESSGEKDLDDPTGKVWIDNRFNIREYVAKYGVRKCEANAIVVVPEIGRKMLQNAIDRWLGEGAYEDYEEALEVKRDRAKQLIKDRLNDEYREGE